MTEIIKEKFKIQDEEYSIPYHHLVGFKKFSNAWVMPWGEEYYAYVSKVLELSKKYNPASIIDIGCGDGKIGFELSRLYGKTIRNVGVDLSERSILLAKALNWQNGAEFFAKPISEINETFDQAMLVEVLEHIPDQEIPNFVASVEEVINSSGKVIVTVPSDNVPVIKKHYRHYNLDLLKKHMTGFTLEEVYYSVKTGPLSGFLNRCIRKTASIGFLRNFFFKVFMIFYSEGTVASSRHIVAVFKKS
jgi:2-polyprenyl-3-methyl-5-hydroxy-6-metoxy-1,4-benzoquinol methylase